MSKASLAKKSECEEWQALWEKFQKERPGAFGVAPFTEWCLANGHADLPKVNPLAILHRKIRQALREVRTRDPDGTLVRGMLPAKVPAVDENGNMTFDVEWDSIHRMSADHALLSFEQRDQNIGKQRRSANRDLQSFLKFNPNAKGHESDFRYFSFMDDPSETPPPPQKIKKPKRKPK